MRKLRDVFFPGLFLLAFEARLKRPLTDIQFHYAGAAPNPWLSSSWKVVGVAY
jgi:hypothetical protein